MVRRYYVCKNCKSFTTEKVCPICKSKDLSVSWKGLVIVIDTKDSEIAKVLNIEVPGKYTLFVG